MEHSAKRSTQEQHRLVDRERFRSVMSHFASGVTIITTRHEGIDYGLTASAVSSLSLDPPMLLICVNKASNTRDAIAKSQVFAVNILRENQSEVAKHFASSRPDKFGGVSVSYEALGVPLLGDVLATLERFGSATGESVSLLRSCSISLCNPWVFAILLSVGRN
jgi:flavin reductase (DIM6/NTAB) family NADH-FMN oxidoreductase RutF